MPPVGNVPALDKAEYGVACFDRSLEAPPVEELAFQFGVMNYSVRASLRESHLESIEHQPRRRVSCHRPAHDPPAERIERDREKEKSRPGGHVGDISYPERVGPVRDKAPLQKIRNSDLGLRSLRCDNKAPATPLKPSSRMRRATRLRPTRSELSLLDPVANRLVRWLKLFRQGPSTSPSSM